MHAPDYSGKTWSEQEVFWVTIGYLRAWWATDGPRLALIRQQGGMTARMLRNLGNEYKVNRSFVKKDVGGIVQRDRDRFKDDPAAEIMCELLARACASWNDDLTERAETCAAIARDAAERGITKLSRNQQTRDLPVSAVTKFMWFLRPDGWTVYDRFARDGLEQPTVQAAIDDMLAFYKTLKDLDFVELVGGMNAVIGKSPFKGLPAERILDTLLMARGGRGADETSG